MPSESSPKFEKLGKSNYPEWSGEMKAWLMKMGYWRLVSEKERRPSDPDAAEEWDIKQEKASAEIYLCVTKDQRVHFRDCEEDPIRMWK